MLNGFRTKAAAQLASKLEGPRYRHTYFKSTDGRWYRVLVVKVPRG